MSLKVKIPLFLSAIVFLISYFFFAKSQGQLECSSQIGSAEPNKIGGIVGMSLAGLLLFVSLYFWLTTKYEIVKTETVVM